MSIPSASLTTVAIQKESSLAGSGTSNIATLRITSESLVSAVSTIASDEIDSTRNVADLNKVSSQAEGEIEFEMSPDAPMDVLLQAVFQDTAGNVAVGLADADTVDNGTTQTSFKIEKKTTDGTTNFFQKYEGMVPSTLELTAESGSFVTGTIGFLGSKVNTMSGSASLTPINNDASETTPFTTVDTNTTVSFNTNAASLTPGDYTELTGVKATAFSISIDNGLRAQTQIGSTDLAGIGSGRFNITGSLTIYADGSDAQTIFNNYINTTAFGMMLQIGDTNDKYQFVLPEVKITSAQTLAGGNDEDVLMEIEWQAVKSTVGSDVVSCRLIKVGDTV